MQLMRRDPVGDFRSLQYDLNRFFNSAFPGLMDSEEGLVRGSWSPAVDIHEDTNSFTLEADLPGLKPGDFELSIENYTLTIRGERNLEKKEEGKNYHRVERSYGSFTRTFSLPQTVNVEAVQADFKDGVLRVTLPKREEVKPRQIQISVKTEADASKSAAVSAKESK